MEATFDEMRMMAAFVLDQHVEFDFCSARSLKRQSVNRHVAPLGHIILISSQSFLIPQCGMISREAANPNCSSLWFDPTAA